MPIEIIAELAQGFTGHPEQERFLMKTAAAGRADVVKFKWVYAEELATPDYEYFGLFGISRGLPPEPTRDNRLSRGLGILPQDRRTVPGPRAADSVGAYRTVYRYPSRFGCSCGALCVRRAMVRKIV